MKFNPTCGPILALYLITPYETHIHQNSWNSISVNPIPMFGLDLCPFPCLVVSLFLVVIDRQHHDTFEVEVVVV
jgi:hypothetical protein